MIRFWKETLIGCLTIVVIVLFPGLVVVGIAVSLFDVNPWAVFGLYFLCVILLARGVLGPTIPGAKIHID